jgi:hypothetical protein
MQTKTKFGSLSSTPRTNKKAPTKSGSEKSLLKSKVDADLEEDLAAIRAHRAGLMDLSVSKK